MSSSMSLIQYKEQFFIFQDSLGDGNCLYHSIVNSGVLDVMTHVDLRKQQLVQSGILLKEGWKELM
jgi:hypothetical protein